MPTLYKRLNRYCNITKSTFLTDQERQQLGKIIAQSYWNYKHPETAVQYATFTDADTGKISRVISYPHTFTPLMDAIIKEYYAKKYPPPTKRKRIPVKSTPIYSTKK